MCIIKCTCRKLIFIIVSLSIAVLAWLFQLYPQPWLERRSNDPPPVSYDGRITFNLDHLYTPESHDEIVSIVENAYEQNQKIRVLAAGHSWSEIAQTQDIMISLHKYSGLININKENLSVTVKAGTQLRHLSELLDEQGLAMINLGSVANQSVAGAISTATHGTGIDVGNLAALVTKLKFVSGKGETKVVSENDEDPSTFRATVVSIGMFGVLSEITLHVENAFRLKEIASPHTLDYCLDNLDSLVKGHQFVKFWVEFYNDFCFLYQTNKTEDDISGRPGRIKSFLVYYSFAVTTRVTYLFSCLTPYAMWLVNTFGFKIFGETIRVDKSYLIFNDYFELPIHQESEIIVPYKHSVELVKTIRDLVQITPHPVNYITEVRFIKGDDNYLSPSYGMEDGVCAVTLTIYGTERVVNKYFDAVYDATRKFNGRIHWGKYFTAGSKQFHEWYPKFQKFANLRAKYDPNGIFLNDFLRERFNFP